MEDTRPVEGFPDYLIDRNGTVYTEASGLKRKPSKTRDGAMKITLYRDGKPYTKSLSLLVAKTWVYNDFDPDIFDTPIHLDNDQENNHADNLAWRPRWFAVKYQRQYWNEEFRFSRVVVREKRSGIVYDTIMQACQYYGYLYMDVLKSCTKHESVFPTWKEFEFVD